MGTYVVGWVLEEGLVGVGACSRSGTGGLRAACIVGTLVQDAALRHGWRVGRGLLCRGRGCSRWTVVDWVALHELRGALNCRLWGRLSLSVSCLGDELFIWPTSISSQSKLDWRGRRGEAVAIPARAARTTAERIMKVWEERKAQRLQVSQQMLEDLEVREREG